MKVIRDKKPKSRIPDFNSLEEEATWWETHNLADYQDEFETVDASFAKNLSHGLTIPGLTRRP